MSPVALCFWSRWGPVLQMWVEGWCPLTWAFGTEPRHLSEGVKSLGAFEACRPSQEWPLALPHKPVLLRAFLPQLRDPRPSCLLCPSCAPPQELARLGRGGSVREAACSHTCFSTPRSHFPCNFWELREVGNHGLSPFQQPEVRGRVWLGTAALPH